MLEAPAATPGLFLRAIVKAFHRRDVFWKRNRCQGLSLFAFCTLQFALVIVEMYNSDGRGRFSGTQLRTAPPRCNSGRYAPGFSASPERLESERKKRPRVEHGLFRMLNL